MAIAALMGVGTAVKGEEVPSLDLNFDGQASSGTGDNHFDDVVLFLDGSSTTDLSPAGNNFTSVNGANVLSMTGPYGTTQNVLNFDGVNDYAVETTASGDFTFGTDDFTIEAWLKADVTPSGTTPGVIDYDWNNTSGAGVNGYNDYFVLHQMNNTLDYAFFANTASTGSVGEMVRATVANTTDWNHIAITRVGSTVKMYLNGVLTDTSTDLVANMTSNRVNPKLFLGYQDLSSRYWNGKMADVRITKGVARYTSNFTPPSHKLPTAKDATALGQLATDIVSCTRSTTATFMGSNGLIQTAAVNTPRLEYDASGNPLGLLVEEARTNYVLRSQALDNSVWVTPTISTVDANVHNAPDGTATADRVNVNTAGYIYQTASGLTQNTEYTASWFIKADSATAFVYGFYNQTGGAWITRTEYDPTTGEDFGNGWYRFSVNVTTPIGCTSIRVYPLRHDTGGASNAVTGADGSSYVWGLQIEAGEGATSYIPTSGAAATRAADDITLATSSFGLDKVYGTALIDATVASEAAGTAVGIFEMVTHPYKRNLMTYIDTAQNKVFAQYSETNFTGNLIASGVTYPLHITATVRRDGATGGGAANGTLLSSVTIDTATTTPTALRLGYLDGSGTMNGHIRRFIYWPRAINDAQLSKFTNQ